MGLDGQFERMAALYAEKSSDELEALYASREDLTEVAEEALTHVLRQRGISLHPAQPQPMLPVVVSGGQASESALAADEVCLYTFDDAFRATEALRLLDNADIPARVVDWNALAPNPADRSPMLQLGVVVQAQDHPAATMLMQDKLGLLSQQPEGDDPFEELTGLVLVARLERSEALLVAQALGTEGISYLWNDDRDDRNASADLISIEVRSERLDRANQLMDHVLGD